MRQKTTFVYKKKFLVKFLFIKKLMEPMEIDNRPPFIVDRYDNRRQAGRRHGAASVIQAAWRNRQLIATGARAVGRAYNSYNTPPPSNRRPPVTRKRGGSVRRGGGSGIVRTGGGVAPTSWQRHKKTTSKRKFRGKRKRKLRGTKSLRVNQGQMNRNEVTQKVTDVQCVYIGHTNFAPATLVNAVARSIVKEFWTKEGFVPETDASIGPTFASQYIINAYPTPQSLVSVPTISSTVILGSTFLVHAISVAALLNTVISAADKRYKFMNMQWKSVETIDYRFNHQCNMLKSMLTLNLHSQISFQNSTANASGAGETDVNNANPLQVSHYYGNGNGTEMVVRGEMIAGPPTYTAFIGDANNGNIAVAAKQQGSNSTLSEPPNAKYFHNTKGGKKFELQPGAIHRSSLKQNFKMSISAFIHLFDGYPSADKVILNRGKWEMWAAEKIVSTNVAGAPSTVPVQLDYEIDYKFAVAFRMQKPGILLPIISAQVALGDL